MGFGNASEKTKSATSFIHCNATLLSVKISIFFYTDIIKLYVTFVNIVFKLPLIFVNNAQNVNNIFVTIDGRNLSIVLFLSIRVQ